MPYDWMPPTGNGYLVTASGSLELRHASETANSTQVMTDTMLELSKIA